MNSLDDFSLMTLPQPDVLHWRFQFRIVGWTEFPPFFRFNSLGEPGNSDQVESWNQTCVTLHLAYVELTFNGAGLLWGRKGQLATMQGVHSLHPKFQHAAKNPLSFTFGPRSRSPGMSCRALVVFKDFWVIVFHMGQHLMLRWSIVVGCFNQESAFRDHLSTQKRQWGAIECNWCRTATIYQGRELQELYLANSFGSCVAWNFLVYRNLERSFNCVGDSPFSWKVDRSSWFFPSSTGPDWIEDLVAFINLEHLLSISRVSWNFWQVACFNFSNLVECRSVLPAFGIGRGFWSRVQAQWVTHVNLAMAHVGELVWYSVGYATYVNYGVFAFSVCLVVVFFRSGLMGSVLRSISLVFRPSTRDGYWGFLIWWLLFFNLSTTTGVWGLRSCPGFGFVVFGWIFSPTNNSIGRLLLWVAGRIGPFHLVHVLCFISRGVTVHKLELTEEKKRSYYGKWSYVVGEAGDRSEGVQVFCSVNLQFCSCSFNCCSVTTCHK